MLGLYIDKLPVEGRFAHSFAGIFNMDYVESTVIIDPLLEESQKKINRRIRSLDMERSGNGTETGSEFWMERLRMQSGGPDRSTLTSQPCLKHIFYS